METGPQPPLLYVSDLSVAFSQGGKETLAVDRVSFDIAKGETVALVGESGSGKSVTAHGVMGLLPKGQLRAVAGSIALQGEDLLRAPESRLRELRWEIARRRYRVAPELVAEAIVSGLDPPARPD